MPLLNIKWAYYRLGLLCALLSGLLIVNSCAVTQCGVLQMQKANKPGTGIAVSNNSCTGPDMSLQSLVYLQADTSVRFKSSSGDSEQKIICQNLSSIPLKIRVASASSPWILPEHDKLQCNDWLNNGRLECNETWSSKKMLICAISEQVNAIDLPGSSGKTSIKTRSPSQPDEIDIDMEMEKEMEQVDGVLVNYIRPKIDQCRKEFNSDQVITLAWTIKSNGVVIDTDIPGNIRKDKFVDCAIEVIEDWIFPSFKSDVPVTRTF